MNSLFVPESTLSQPTVPHRIGLDLSALDPTFKAHAGRGIGRYVQSLWNFFSLQTDPTLNVQGFDYSWFHLPRAVEGVINALPAGRQTIRQQLCYPLQLASSKMSAFEVVHFPAHMDAPSWTRKPYILTVLDLIPLVLSSLYDPSKRSLRFRLARALEIRAIRGASLILAISECTARDVTSLLGIPRDRIVVTPLGIDSKSFTSGEKHGEFECGAALSFRHRYSIPADRQILLYVGGIDERKNIGGMLEILREVLHEKTLYNRQLPVLVLAGGISADKNYGMLLKQIALLKLEQDVVLTGFLSHEDLSLLYQMSTLFLFPSLYEGFGLPPLEAMASGTVVVSSNTSSMPEVLGDAALFFDPYQPSEGAHAVTTALNDTALRETLRARGLKRAKHFTWDRTGHSTLGAYQQFFECRNEKHNKEKYTKEKLPEPMRRGA